MGAREKAVYTRKINAKREALGRILSNKDFLFGPDMTDDDKKRNHRFLQNIQNEIAELERLRERL